MHRLLRRLTFPNLVARAPHVAPYVALIIALLLTGILGFQRRELRALVREYHDRLEYAYSGMVVPTVHTSTLDGKVAVIGETSSRRQLIFVFNTHCPYCLETLPEWKRLADEFGSSTLHDVEVIGIAVDSLRKVEEYVAKHSLDFPVVIFPRSKIRQLYRTHTVPLTLVLDSTGVARYAGLGSLIRKPEIVDSVYAAIGPER